MRIIMGCSFFGVEVLEEINIPNDEIDGMNDDEIASHIMKEYVEPGVKDYLDAWWYEEI